MSQARIKKPKKTNYHPFLKTRLKEGGFILLEALAVFFLLSLISYNPYDPSLSYTGFSAATKIQNIGGLVGAWLSDILLYSFGYASFLLPLGIGVWGWRLWRTENIFDDEEVKPKKWSWRVARLVGLLLSLSMACALASLYVPVQSGVPFVSGGVLGEITSGVLVEWLNKSGATILAAAIGLSGLTLVSGVSWFSVFEFLGVSVIKGIKISWLSLIAGLKKIKFKREPKVAVAGAPISAFTPTAETKPKVSTPRPFDPPKSSPKVEPVKVKPKKEKRGLLGRSKKVKVSQDGMPEVNLLDEPCKASMNSYTKQQLEDMSSEVEARLADFSISAKVMAVYPGPVVTRFELDLAPGTKVSRITNLAKDLARALSVVSVRIVEVIPGKSVIGLELPNREREMVRLKEIIDTDVYRQATTPLALALGKDIAGTPIVVDLCKMPHLLVAGTTGSGKSVSLNAILLSLLYKSSPEEMRLILIDPKMLELSVYDGIPHLLTPVVTDMKDAANALRWCVVEMERRYQLMAALGVRNIAGFNTKIKQAREKGEPINNPFTEMGDEPVPLDTLPNIMVLADEFADMMMVVGKKVEELIARLAQKARAAGIHLILATQRPSVDVITGLIKANIPTRIAFQVSSRIDSRTILDQQGAEQLLGNGDMLYLPPGSGVPVRVHGAFVSDDEVHRVVADWKERGDPDYSEDILDANISAIPGIDSPGTGSDSDDPEQDPLYDEAVQIVLESRKASVSNIQRRLKIGYNRAARIVDAMEAAGLVGPMGSNGAREILVPPQ